MKYAHFFRVLNVLILGILATSKLYSAGEEHWGYVDAREEKDQLSYILQIEKPILKYQSPVGSFGPDLTSELKARYKQEFGYTNAEIGISQMEYFLQHNQTTGSQEGAAAYLEKQKKFANYVVRRYGESLLDEYLKESEKLNPAYEVKKRVTSISVHPKPEVEFLGSYNLSGNYLNFKWIHPKYRVEMTADFIRGKLGPTDVQEYVIRLHRKFERKLSFDLYHKVNAELSDIVFTKLLTTNLSLQWQTHLDLDSKEGRQEDRRSYLGVSYSY